MLYHWSSVWVLCTSKSGQINLLFHVFACFYKIFMIFLNVGPLRRAFFDHHLWFIFQSLLHTLQITFFFVLYKVLTELCLYMLTIAMCEGHKQKKGSSYIASGLALCGDLFMCSTSLAAIAINFNINGCQFRD